MTPAVPRDFANNAKTYEAALVGMFRGNPEDAEEYLSQILTPNFIMIGNGETFDYPQMIEHMRFLRKLDILPVDKSSFETTHFLVEGKRRAERHVSRSMGPEGKLVESETYQFVDIADDGRIEKILETVRVFDIDSAT